MGAMLLLCALASLTYLLNDIADLEADRQHWSKKDRPFASGALKVRHGQIAAGIGIPPVLLLGGLIGPETALVLVGYAALTMAYSLGLKCVPLLDGFVIGSLVTLRARSNVSARTDLF